MTKSPKFIGVHLGVGDIQLTAAGFHGHLSPIDAFWGNRYAEVDDPDGNIVGFHSATDPTSA